MTEPNTYLIQGSDCLARFQISRVGNLIYLHNGASTTAFSSEDAKALAWGILAVCHESGHFQVAETEIAIRLRAEALERRRASALAHQPPPDSSSSPRPTLEQL